MKPTDRSVSEALSGLKPQVQSAPFSLEMVSTLLVDVVPLPLELELEPEPALQPAASKPAATMAPYLVRRLMPFRPYCRVVLTVRGAGGCALTGDWRRASACASSSLRAYVASMSIRTPVRIAMSCSFCEV